MPNPKSRQKIFISYSHKDSSCLDRLRPHLKGLEKKGLVELWDDTKIKPGKNWKDEITSALSSASIAIVLLSADFIASDFIGMYELPVLLKRAKEEGLNVIFIVVNYVHIEPDDDLLDFQYVNPPSKPIKAMPEAEQDKYFSKLCKEIYELCLEMSVDVAEGGLRFAGSQFAPVLQLGGKSRSNSINKYIALSIAAFAFVMLVLCYAIILFLILSSQDARSIVLKCIVLVSAIFPLLLLFQKAVSCIMHTNIMDIYLSEGAIRKVSDSFLQSPCTRVF